MSSPPYTPEEVAARGEAIYEEQIRARVEPEHIGKFLVIDIETGEYVLDEDDVVAMKRAAQQHRPETLYGMRIGYPTMGRIGTRIAGTTV